MAGPGKSFSAIALKSEDNVATALRNLAAGSEVAVSIADKITTLKALDEIEFGHKLALRDIAKGEDILKYGEVIGRATAAIPAGRHAHVQNVESLRGRGDLAEGEK